LARRQPGQGQVSFLAGARQGFLIDPAANEARLHGVAAVIWRAMSQALEPIACEATGCVPGIPVKNVDDPAWVWWAGARGTRFPSPGVIARLAVSASFLLWR
jgi:hypothetical protein